MKRYLLGLILAFVAFTVGVSAYDAFCNSSYINEIFNPLIPNYSGIIRCGPGK
jgi:hypothetical protein